MIDWKENMSQLVSGRLPVSQATFDYYNRLYWSMKQNPLSDAREVEEVYEWLMVLATRVDSNINSEANWISGLKNLSQGNNEVAPEIFEFYRSKIDEGKDTMTFDELMVLEGCMTMLQRRLHQFPDGSTDQTLAQQCTEIEQKINMHLNSANALEGLRRHVISERIASTNVLSQGRVTDPKWRVMAGPDWLCRPVGGFCTQPICSETTCPVARVYVRLAEIEDIVFNEFNEDGGDK